MLASIVLVVGLGLIVAGLLDLLLSKEQKDAIDLYVHRIWNEVDEAKKLSLVERQENPRIVRISLIPIAVLWGPWFLTTVLTGEPQARIIAVATLALLALILRFAEAFLAFRYVNWVISLVMLPSLIWGNNIHPDFPLTVSITLILTMLIVMMYGAAIYMVSYFIGALELVLRRVAEYPKGSIAAAGILLTAASALVKQATG